MNKKPLNLNIAEKITHSVFGALLISFVVWHFTRSAGPSYFFLFVQCFPLCILIPGMFLQRPRTYIWLCFIMLVYFVKGVDGLVFPSRAWVDVVILSSSIVLFISSMFTSRWLQQYQTH